MPIVVGEIVVPLINKSQICPCPGCHFQFQMHFYPLPSVATSQFILTSAKSSIRPLVHNAPVRLRAQRRLILISGDLPVKK